MRPSRRLGFFGWRPLVVTHDDPWMHGIQRSAAANSTSSCLARRASRRACERQQLLGHARATQPRDVYIFMPVGEIGLSPCEMQHVSGLPVGAFPYEEHVPPSVELELLKEKDPELYSTY